MTARVLMTPSDPRHGTTAGYHQRCRCPRCMAAIARYQKSLRLDAIRGVTRLLSPVGAQRRITALMALGWTALDIAAAGGWESPTRNYVLRILAGQKGHPTKGITPELDQRIRTAYDTLSMRLPDPSPATARARAHAARKGYVPPLAWDDDLIDDPDARPHGVPARRANEDRTRRRDQVDEAVVLRVLAGEVNLRTTRAEREEIVARHLAAGGSEHELCERLGWRDGRYSRRAVAA